MQSEAIAIYPRMYCRYSHACCSLYRPKHTQKKTGKTADERVPGLEFNTFQRYYNSSARGARPCVYLPGIYGYTRIVNATLNGKVCITVKGRIGPGNEWFSSYWS